MSLLAPFGLALAALAAPLAALYFLKLRRERVVVPSLLWWQALKEQERRAQPFDRFRHSLLFWFQLLALLLLALALAEPILRGFGGAGRALVLVVDRTASMGAKSEKTTRFELGRAAALARVGALSAADEVMLVSVGPSVRVEAPFTRDHRVVTDALDALTVAQAEGSLRDGLDLAFTLAKSRPDGAIVVVSDGSHEDLSTLPPAPVPVERVDLGENVGNGAIVGVDLRRSPLVELQQQLFLAMRWFGPGSPSGDVEVYLDDRLLERRAVTLGAGETVPAVFDLPPGASGTVQAILVMPDDSLKTDDVAFAMVRPVADRRVLLVGGDKLTWRALASDPRVKLDVAGPAGIAAEQYASYDAVIVGSAVTPSMLGVPSLILGPLPGSPGQYGAPVESPRVLSWRRTHPLARFVTWEGLRIARSYPVDDDGGLTAIVDGDVGPLVLAGEIDGVRRIQLTFHPLETDLPLRVGWPVFLMNAVGWLTERGAGSAQAVVQTGSPLSRRFGAAVDPKTVAAQDPDEDSVAVEVLDDRIRVGATEKVGVWRLQAGTWSERFALNLLSERESDLRPDSRFVLTGNAGAAGQGGDNGELPLWRWAVIAVLALLVIEWALWRRGLG